MNVNVILGITFSGIGLLFFLIGLVFKICSDKRYKAATATTTATVVDTVRRLRRNNSDYNYYPVYEYFVQEKMYRIRSAIGSSPCVFKTGDVVEIRYNQENPNQYYIPREKKLKDIIAGVFVICGVVILILGISLYMLL